MSTKPPLILWMFFVPRPLPHLSFSNPPLPLSFIRAFFLSFIKYLFYASCLLSMAVQAEGLTFSINTSEGGLTKDRYQKAMVFWLDSQGCAMSVMAQGHNVDADFIFDVKAESSASPVLVPTVEVLKAPNSQVSGITSPIFRPFLSSDLESVWLIKRSSLGGGVNSLKDERVALLSASSLVGHQRPLKQLEVRGLSSEHFQMIQTDQYQGAMTLLLHGDAFAAAVPRVLAERWMEPNALGRLIHASDAERFPPLQAGIWMKADTHPMTDMEAQCMDVLSSLVRSGRRDLKMRLFPEWVSGFTHHR